jgi:hypothetical protein
VGRLPVEAITGQKGFSSPRRKHEMPHSTFSEQNIFLFHRNIDEININT